MSADPLKVLLTNRILRGHSGTETYVRDLALALLRRGHRPYVYCPVLGPIAEELDRATVPVVAKLDDLGVAPDVIHGNDHPQFMEALSYFPNIPGIFLCHSWDAPTAFPPLHPRIRAYAAVDYTCKERVLAIGIPEERVHVLLNAVDLNRFQLREPLPERPRKALIFTNYSYDVTPIEAACRELGIALDRRGDASQNRTANPEQILGTYDIVFGKARAALEAMASGCAVVICDFRGLGGLVTSDRWEQLRRLNFGVRTMQTPLTPEVLRREIEKYDSLDARAVAMRVRNECSLEALVSQWEELFGEVIAEQRSAPQNYAEEGRAMARYLRDWGFERRREWERQKILSWVPEWLVRWVQRRIASSYKPSGT